MRVDKPAEGWFANGADSQVKVANLDALVKDYYTESSDFSNWPKYNYWIEEWGYVDSADAVFKLDGSLFHVECQTSRMSSMRFRMLEYDIAIAIAEARRDGGAKLVFLPRSIVVCTAGSAADLEIGLMSGRESEPDVSPSVVECRAYGIDEMVSKGLYLLVPFYLVRYERRMRRPGGPTASARSAYLQDCARLSDAMTSVLAKEGDELCNEVMQQTVRVSDHILRGQDELAGEARSAMGGEVLELFSEKMERYGHENRQEGRRENRRENRQEGRKIWLVTYVFAKMAKNEFTK